MSDTIDYLLTISFIILPLLGGFFTVYMFYKRDVLEKEPKKLVLKTFLWGVAMGLVIISISIPTYFAAERVITKLSKDWAIICFMISLVIVIAIIEELIKGFALRYLCQKGLSREINGLFDGFFYGVILGTGTGVVDSVANSILATDWFENLRIVVIKYVRVSGTHALFTGLVGLFLVWKQLEGKKAVHGFLIAIELHIVWSCVTYILYYYLTTPWVLYLTNFSIAAIYLTGMFILPFFLIKADKTFTSIESSSEEKSVV